MTDKTPEELAAEAAEAAAAATDASKEDTTAAPEYSFEDEPVKPAEEAAPAADYSDVHPSKRPVAHRPTPAHPHKHPRT